MPEHKKTKEQIKQEVAKRLEEIDYLREMAREQGHGFASLDEKELETKIKGEDTKSPYLYFSSFTIWSTNNNYMYSVLAGNPDPYPYTGIYLTIFFGLGVIHDVNDAWIGRDKRLTAVSSLQEFLPADETRRITIHYSLPTDLPGGTYNGNAVLWQTSRFGNGRLFDNGSFHVHPPDLPPPGM